MFVAMKYLSIVALSLITVCCTAEHTYHLGPCPSVPPMPDFDMSRFLGVWYVVQRTFTGSRCLTYNFEETTTQGEYKLVRLSKNPALELVKIDLHEQFTGTLRIPQKDHPGQMSVKYNLSPLGPSIFTVFLTDYDNYAGVYTCMNMPMSSRQSIAILSRTPKLDHEYLEKVKDKMTKCGLNPVFLSAIDHRNCPKVEDPNSTPPIDIRSQI